MKLSVDRKMQIPELTTMQFHISIIVQLIDNSTFNINTFQKRFEKIFFNVTDLPYRALKLICFRDIE